MARELSPEEIAKLFIPKARKSRAKSDPNLIENRTIKVWFALDQQLAFCTNSDCPDVRPKKVTEGNAMCSVVGSHTMCRLCFLDGFGLDTDSTVM